MLQYFTCCSNNYTSSPPPPPFANYNLYKAAVCIFDTILQNECHDNLSSGNKINIYCA
jgi:hypothetical protein